jgi:hypothetical protein
LKRLTKSILAVGHADGAADEKTFPVVEQVVVPAFADHVGDKYSVSWNLGSPEW